MTFTSYTPDDAPSTMEDVVTSANEGDVVKQLDYDSWSRKALLTVQTNRPVQPVNLWTL